MISPGRVRVPWRRLLIGPLACGIVLGNFAVANGAGYDPTGDAYSMAAVAQQVGARAWWNMGYTGAGIDVAVIDTGVAPVRGLDSPGKVVYGADLSFESQAPNLRYLDTYGHGTFMAGLIAGRDPDLTRPYWRASSSSYRGIAPDARIVSVKVGSADGSADVTQVIAAINWVVEHRTDNGLNIRVLNLSYGTNSLQASTSDPLSYAVEQAWKKGIVVVAAAGNTGFQVGHGAPGLADPAYNSFIIGVGAYDTKGTAYSQDDVIAPCSASSTGRNSTKDPDFVAPGAHVQGLRVPNSFIDASHPEGRLGDRYFRGTGTSQAAAITSGAVALILQKYPSLNPDSVKRYITDNAQRFASFSNNGQGKGELNLARMLTVSPKSDTQHFTSALGSGTIEGARGSDHLSLNNFVLSGEKDIFGHAIDTSLLATAEAAGNTWTGGIWNGNTWTGSAWTGSAWTGNTWTGNTWTGSAWTGNTWTGNTWTGNTWTSGNWTGNTWTGNTWTGSVWATGSWT